MLESKWIHLHQILCAVAGHVREFRISTLLEIRKKIYQHSATTLTFHPIACRVNVNAMEVGYFNE